jgi:hypothetical protein
MRIPTRPPLATTTMRPVKSSLDPNNRARNQDNRKMEADSLGHSRNSRMGKVGHKSQGPAQSHRLAAAQPVQDSE